MHRPHTGLVQEGVQYTDAKESVPPPVLTVELDASQRTARGPAWQQNPRLIAQFWHSAAAISWN
jgi:hypothetical protein